MKKNIKIGLFTLALFIGCGIFSCSKNLELNTNKNIDKVSKIDRGEPMDIGLNLLSSNQSKDNLSHKNSKGKENDIYGLKISKRSILDPNAKMEEYAYGIFEEKEIENLTFTGYNLEEYNIEATVINKGTGLGLFHMGNKYYAPFYANLENKFVYAVNKFFKPGDYFTDMKVIEKDFVFFEAFNHAELNRYYGCTESFIPDRTKKSNKVMIDLYRVSFDLSFEAIGETLTKNQQIKILLKTGQLPGGSDETYTFIINDKSEKFSDHKIIAFGLNNDDTKTSYYKQIYTDTNYTQKYAALAILETFDETGKLIEAIPIGDTNKLSVQRNHKTTYTIKVSKTNTDVKIGFKFKDSHWIDDEKKPFPSETCNINLD